MLFWINASKALKPQSLHLFHQMFWNSCNCCNSMCYACKSNEHIGMDIHGLNSMEKKLIPFVVQWLKRIACWAKPNLDNILNGSNISSHQPLELGHGDSINFHDLYKGLSLKNLKLHYFLLHVTYYNCHDSCIDHVINMTCHRNPT
jgi:hypothetical protein